jgi:hypothetical protein
MLKKMKIKLIPGYQKQQETDAYLNHKFMMIYDLVNDSKTDKFHDFFADPEGFEAGNIDSDANENIKKVFEDDADMSAYFRSVES